MIEHKKYRGRIIDIHTHIGSCDHYKTLGLGFFWSKLSVIELIKHMRRRGIDYAVLLPSEDVDDLEDEGFYIPTDCVLEICKIFSEELVPFCWFEPRDPNLLNKIRDYVINRGCRGVGEIKSRIRVDHPVLMKVYELCARLEVPVLIHLENRYDYDIAAFERVIKKYSSTVFIAHGPGWWREISADADSRYWKKREVAKAEENYPKGRVIPGGYVERLLDECDNLYGDLSAYSGYNALVRDLEYARQFLRKFHKKLLYGSDGLDYFFPKYDLIRVMLEMDLEEGIYRDILYENAAKLLKLILKVSVLKGVSNF